MSQSKRLRCMFANRREEAPHVAHQLDVFLTNLPEVDESTVNKFLLSADELITNILSHAYDDDEEHAVELVCKLEDDELMMEIRDDGKAFNPTAELSPLSLLSSVDDRPIGGLGIHLVMELMDRVVYVREGDYNVLRVYKNLNRA